MCGKYENIRYNHDSGSGLQVHSLFSHGQKNGKFSQKGKFGQGGEVH